MFNWRQSTIISRAGLRFGPLRISFYDPRRWASPRRIPLILFRRHANAWSFQAPGVSVYWMVWEVA